MSVNRLDAKQSRGGFGSATTVRKLPGALQGRAQATDEVASTTSDKTSNKDRTGAALATDDPERELRKHAVKGNLPALKAILDEGGVKLDAKNEVPCNLLPTNACEAPALTALHQLVPCLLCVPQDEKGGNTALILAAKRRGPDAYHGVKALLEAGADATVQNKDGKTALENAIACSSSKSIKTLLERAELRKVRPVEKFHFVAHENSNQFFSDTR